MAAPNLMDLMRLYARRGISDWKGAPEELRRRASYCLGAEIADNDAEAMVTISTVYNQANASRLRFIPMPKHPRSGAERYLFLPIREMDAAGRERIAFDLFMLVARRDCLAFRFEPAHRPPSTHSYGHVQMSRMMLKKSILVQTLPWLPDSYPAFPLPASDPLKMFLSMATAVHGYTAGVVTVLQQIFQAASRTGEAGLYINELTKLLN
jgi:hypothetical protein